MIRMKGLRRWLRLVGEEFGVGTIIPPLPGECKIADNYSALGDDFGVRGNYTLPKGKLSDGDKV